MIQFSHSVFLAINFTNTNPWTDYKNTDMYWQLSRDCFVPTRGEYFYSFIIFCLISLESRAKGSKLCQNPENAYWDNPAYIEIWDKYIEWAFKLFSRNNLHYQDSW